MVTKTLSAFIMREIPVGRTCFFIYIISLNRNLAKYDRGETFFLQEMPSQASLPSKHASANKENVVNYFC